MSIERYISLRPYCNTPLQRKRLEAVIRYGSVTRAATVLGIRHQRISETLNGVIKRSQESDDHIIGVIGDTHIPYEHPDYLQFCIDTFNREGVTKVIHIGDLIDNHALSFHDSEPGLKGAHGEYVDALERLQPWKDAFPEMIVIHGNHDMIPARQMKKIGLNPDLYLRPLSQVYEFPDRWTEVEDIEINGVLYHHGHTSVGVNGFRNDAKNRMQNTVSGHAHGNFGVSYTACHHRLVWGMAVGCGIDVSKMAFAYGKHFKNKPILGCGVIKRSGTLPMVFPMDLGES